MKRYSIIVTGFLALCCPASAQEDIQKMSNKELAEYFMVKECSDNVFLVCTDRAKVRESYNSPEVRRNAVAINQKLDQRLYEDEVYYAVHTLGLDAHEARHGRIVKKCGWFSCSWVYQGGYDFDEFR
jgi:hypothetical protein